MNLIKFKWSVLIFKKLLLNRFGLNAILLMDSYHATAVLIRTFISKRSTKQMSRNWSDSNWTRWVYHETLSPIKFWYSSFNMRHNLENVLYIKITKRANLKQRLDIFYYYCGSNCKIYVFGKRTFKRSIQSKFDEMNRKNRF